MKLRNAMALGLLAAGPTAAQEPAALRLVDAVRMTLERQPEIRLQEQQVESARGAFETQRGAFDTLLQASFNRSHDKSPLLDEQTLPGIEDVTSDTWAWNAGASRLFRSGLLAGPQLSYTRIERNVAPIPEARASVSFAIQQPLLRNRGADATAAGERSAAKELDAANLDLRFTISSNLYRTAAAYWAYVASYRSLEIVREAESRFRGLIEEANALIAADQIPASDLKQLRANLASRIAQRVAAEQALFEARQSLGLALGLPASEFASLPPPADALPEVVALGGPGVDPGPMPDMAAERRADLLAARARTRSAELLLGAAESAVKPRLDLVGSVGWAGLDTGSGFATLVSALGERIPGPNAQAGLVFDFPWGNRSAKGQLASRKAIANQAQIGTGDLERQIRSAVAVAMSNLGATAQRVETTRESSELYRSAIDDEKEKLRLGLGTVIDLTVTEDRLTQALLSELDAQYAHAIALARLRFETGTIVAPEGEIQQIDHGSLTTVPGAR